MSNTTAKNDGVNRAKLYQLALFPMNNGATNVYFVLILNFVAQFGSNILQLGLYASVMVTVMRVFDAITDPIIGAMMDKTSTRFGKFRPFMVLGSAIMAVSILALYCLTPLIPETTMWLRYVAFTLIYAVWVIGYTFQTSVTRAGQTVLTNDPNQRPLFTIFNTIGSMLGMGVMQFLIPIVKGMYDVKVDGKIVTDGFAVPEMWAVIAPIGIVLSVLLTILAIFGIAAKDRPEYYGIGGGTQKKVKISEYISIIKANKPMQRLMVAGAGCKLALAIATNATVLTVLYGVMMGDYSGLYLPFMVLGYVFAVPFFILSVRTSQKFGQKASLERYVRVALISYIGVLVLLILCGGPTALWARLVNPVSSTGINVGNILYSLAFVIFFGVGYGAYYATADMPIPMVADCSDYETYRSGKYIPGIMGTLFSLVDKLVSSLAPTLVALIFWMALGTQELPNTTTTYSTGIKVAIIIMFCVIPMLAWAATLWAMKGYSLTGAKMKEIQAVNRARKAAVNDGMTLEQAMDTIKTTEDAEKYQTAGGKTAAM